MRIQSVTAKSQCGPYLAVLCREASGSEVEPSWLRKLSIQYLQYAIRQRDSNLSTLNRITGATDINVI